MTVNANDLLWPGAALPDVQEQQKWRDMLKDDREAVREKTSKHDDTFAVDTVVQVLNSMAQARSEAQQSEFDNGDESADADGDEVVKDKDQAQAQQKKGSNGSGDTDESADPDGDENVKDKNDEQAQQKTGDDVNVERNPMDEDETATSERAGVPSGDGAKSGGAAASGAGSV